MVISSEREAVGDVRIRKRCEDGGSGIAANQAEITPIVAPSINDINVVCTVDCQGSISIQRPINVLPLATIPVAVLTCAIVLTTDNVRTVQ